MHIEDIYGRQCINDFFGQIYFHSKVRRVLRYHHPSEIVCNSAVDVISGGLETTVQDGNFRSIGLGIPISGPMDALAFRAANSLVGNLSHTEALEVILPAGMAGPKLYFHVTTIIAITGASVNATVDGELVPTWSRITIPAGGRLALRGLKVGEHKGFRVYIAIRGGFPQIPEYLGSKSTSMGMGGYQVRREIIKVEIFEK